jgi:hypothetical protein
MHFLPNSTKGKQWSEKWRQHYFVLPPNTFNGQLEHDGAASFPGNYSANCAVQHSGRQCGYLNQSVTMWQDDAASLRPKVRKTPTSVHKAEVGHWPTSAL